MNEEHIKLLQTTEQYDSDKNPIYPQTLGRAVYVDINGSTYDLQSAITQGLFYNSLISKTVLINNASQIISIPEEMAVEDENQLLVFQNGLLLNKIENYILNEDKTAINLVGSTYKTRVGDIFTFLYFPFIATGGGSSSGRGTTGGNNFSVVTSISSTSGDSQVPSAKAVYNFINSLVNNNY